MKYFTITILIILAAQPVAFAQDTVVFKNGHVLYGEVKSLNKSVLIMETDYSDSDFEIDWTEMQSLVSGREFAVVLRTGERTFTPFAPSSRPGSVIIRDSEGEEQEVSLENVVILDPVDDDFSDRFTASLSAGLTFTKANNSRQGSVRATAGYHSRKWLLDLNFNAVRTRQDEVPNVERTDGSLNFSYFIYRRWFAASRNEFLSNDEQQLKLRNTHTLAIGNGILRTNRMYLSSSVGLSYNQENYTNKSEIVNSAEGFLGAEFNAYDVGDLNFLTKLSYFPGITESGRNRLNLQADLKYEFPLDFFVKFGFTYNFDSQPPNEGSREDYIFQSTVGWEF